MTNGREKKTSIHSFSCREGLALGRGSGGLTCGTMLPQGLSEEHLLNDLSDFFRKKHTFTLTLWALLGVLLLKEGFELSACVGSGQQSWSRRRCSSAT